MTWDGKERRVNKDEEYGYLKATVEANSAAIKELTTLMKEHAEDEKENISSVKSQIQGLRDELNTYKTVVRVLKAIGASAVLVLSWKLGDIATIWKNM